MKTKTAICMAVAMMASITSHAALIARYGFDGNFSDTSGSATAYNLNVSGTVGTNASHYATFTGAGYLESAGMTASSTFTLSYWWRTSNLAGQASYQGPGFSSNVSGPHQLDDFQFTKFGSDLEVRGAAQMITTPTINFPDGTWYNTVIQSAGGSTFNIWVSAEGGALTQVGNDVATPGDTGLWLQSFIFGANRAKNALGTFDLANVQIYDDATVSAADLLAEGSGVIDEPEPPGSSLVAFYDFGDGDLLDDSSGNAHSLVLGGGAANVTTNTDGWSAHFDGSGGNGSASYLEADLNAAGTRYPEFTVSFWWKTSALNQDTSDSMMSSIDNQSLNDWQLGDVGSDIQLVGDNGTLAKAQSDLSANTWYHTAIVGTSTNASLYLTAEGAAGVNLVGTTPGAFNLQDLRIGANRAGNLTYDSDIGMVKVYDTALDSSQLDLLLAEVDINNAPAAMDQTISGSVNAPIDFALAATDADGDTLSYALVESPATGMLTGTAPNLTYTPLTDFIGSATLTFTASDGDLTSNTGTVTLISAPQNAAELWAHYDAPIRTNALNAVVSTNWVVGDITLHQIRYDLGELTGTQTNASPKIAAYYAYPTSGANLPGIVQIHGGGQRASVDLVKYWAGQGYAAISINWGGLPLLNGLPNTDWDGLAAGFLREGVTNALHRIELDPETFDDGCTLFTELNPMNNSYMLYSMAARRALTFLSAQSNVNSNKLGVTGHSMGGETTVITATDSRITCVTPSVGGTGFLFEDWWGLPGTARPIVTADFDWFNRSVDPQAYWPLIGCPTLFLEASNDFNAPFDLVIKGMGLQSTNVEQRLAVAPHFNHRFDANAYAARVLWQKAHLTDGFDFPETATAQLDLTQPDGIPLFSVWPDESTSNAVVGVDIYYGYDRDSRIRFWRDAQAVETNGHWEAKCPVFDLDEPLVVFAVVTYDCGFDLAMPAGYTNPTRNFSVASKVSTVYPPDLANNGLLATEAPLRLIDDFSRGFHDWFRLNAAHLTLWQNWTRKLVDPSWTGLIGTELTVEVETSVAGNSLGIKLITGQWNETTASAYVATVSLPVAGVNTVSLPASAFTNGLGVALTTWDNVTQLALMPGGLLDSGLSAWAGAFPAFSSLRWTGGDYPGDTLTNGVPSAWLTSYGLEATDASALTDSDLDGLLNWQEYVAGTDPTNSGSVLRLTGVASVDGGWVFDWQAVSGKIYTVWFKTNLSDSAWIMQDSGIPGVEPSTTSTVQTDSATGFVRIEVE